MGWRNGWIKPWCWLTFLCVLSSFMCPVAGTVQFGEISFALPDPRALILSTWLARRQRSSCSCQDENERAPHCFLYFPVHTELSRRSTALPRRIGAHFAMLRKVDI